jgi:hypothetical protein
MVVSLNAILFCATEENNNEKVKDSFTHNSNGTIFDRLQQR